MEAPVNPVRRIRSGDQASEMALEIAARLEADPALLAEVLLMLSAQNVIRAGLVADAMAESVVDLRPAQQVAAFAKDIYRALDQWILE